MLGKEKTETSGKPHTITIQTRVFEIYRTCGEYFPLDTGLF